MTDHLDGTRLPTNLPPDPSPDPSPQPTPDPEPPEPECFNAGCKVAQNNIHTVFPDLEVAPRPTPDPNDKGEYAAWEEEYKQWGGLRCACTRGYFCREHGDWISGEEVGDGVAVSADEQKLGQCPSYHYAGNC